MSNEVKPTTDQAVVPVNTSELVSSEGLLKSLTGGVLPVNMSFDPKTDRGAYLLQKCEEDQTNKLEAMINETLVITDVLTKYIPEYEDPQTGEVRPIMRVCLITKDNEVYGCASEGIAASLVRLWLKHGAPPWPKGVTVKMVQKPGRPPHRRFVLLEQFPQFQGKGK